MSGVNPIRRAFRGDWAWVAGGEPPTARRIWLAICPECGEEVRHLTTYPHYGRATRKNTRDALYRHTREKHREPGLVGTLHASGTHGRA